MTAAEDRKPLVLVVDDKPNMVTLLVKVLRRDARVLTATSGRDAITALADNPVSAVICDLRMPDVGGLEVLDAVRRIRPRAAFVLMTAYASVPTAVEAMKSGAFDYITKPFEPEAVRAVVLRALSKSLAESSSETTDPLLPGMVGRSPAMLEVARMVRKLAPTDATTLVLGETGTGKELVARALHSLSARASRRFVAVNCAAIPGNLLESELYGHARGAFTGADRDRPGLFEEANGGTLFLDEIGELLPSLQAKLTRALEQRAIRRLGESRERGLDVRLVVATHRDLASMVRAGTFREDLWYRLKVATVRVPALRDRGADIPLLAAHFLGSAGSQRPDARPLTGFDDAALEAMAHHSWPGNVRELRGAVQHAALVAEGSRIAVRDLPAELLGENADASSSVLAELSYQSAMETAREEATRRYLTDVLQRFSGRVAAAAEHAGIERESFYRLLRKHGIDLEPFRGRT